MADVTCPPARSDSRAWGGTARPGRLGTAGDAVGRSAVPAERAVRRRVLGGHQQGADAAAGRGSERSPAGSCVPRASPAGPAGSGAARTVRGANRRGGSARGRTAVQRTCRPFRAWAAPRGRAYLLEYRPLLLPAGLRGLRTTLDRRKRFTPVPSHAVARPGFQALFRVCRKPRPATLPNRHRGHPARTGDRLDGGVPARGKPPGAQRAPGHGPGVTPAGAGTRRHRARRVLPRHPPRRPGARTPRRARTALACAAGSWPASPARQPVSSAAAPGVPAAVRLPLAGPVTRRRRVRCRRPAAVRARGLDHRSCAGAASGCTRRAASSLATRLVRGTSWSAGAFPAG